MHKILLSKLKEAVTSVAHVTLIVIIISLTPAVSLTATETAAFIISAIVLIAGIALF